jgi:uncharacterized protein (DUF4213/DUF364 family)
LIDIYASLLKAMLPGRILGVQVSLIRTAVLAETDDGIRCGMAATLTNPEFEHSRKSPVANAGQLHKMRPVDLAGLVESPNHTEASIGLAAINALLPEYPSRWEELNAEVYLSEHGSGKNVAVIGHFPFIDRIRPQIKNLYVLELNPREGDLPANAAPDIIPLADVVAITATTLINKTFQDLIALCRPGVKVMLIGPSTPLTPLLYDFGITLLSGTNIVDPHAVFMGISQAMTSRQLHQAGSLKLVTMRKEG